MVSKSRFQKGSMCIPAGLGLGLLISLILTLAGVGIFSYLIASEAVGEETIRYGIYVIQGVTAAAGSWVAGAVIKKMYLQVSLMSGGAYYLSLLAMTALLFGGQYQGMGVTAAIVMLSSALVAFFPRKNSNHFFKRKKGYR